MQEARLFLRSDTGHGSPSGLIQGMLIKREPIKYWLLFLGPRALSDAMAATVKFYYGKFIMTIFPPKALHFPCLSQECDFYHTLQNNFKKYFYQKYLMAKCCVFLWIVSLYGEFKTTISFSLFSFHMKSEKAILFKVREPGKDFSSSSNREIKLKETQALRKHRLISTN